MDRKLTLTLGAACAFAAAVGAVLLTSAAAGRGAAGVSAQPGGPTVIEVSASPDSQPSPAAAPTAATPPRERRGRSSWPPRRRCWA